MQQLKITLLATNIIPVHFKMLTNVTKLKTLKCYARRFERVYSTNIKNQANTGKVHFTPRFVSIETTFREWFNSD